MLLADGDVLKHRAIKKQPLFLALAYADQRAMNVRKEQAARNTTDDDDSDYDTDY
jgi:hypothetical protein